MNWSVFVVSASLIVCGGLHLSQANAAEADPAATTLDHIGAMNKVSKALGNPPCDVDCEKPNLGSAQCQNNNSYFEAELAKIQTGQAGAMSALVNQGPVDLRLQSCIRQSLDNHGGKFETCDANGHFQRPVVRECSSQNLISALEASFRESVDCLTPFMTGSSDAKTKNTLQKNMFSIMAWESGFHMNAVSPTNAVGLFQVVGAAVSDVNRLNWDKMMRSIENSSAPSCQLIAKTKIQPVSGSSKGKCELVRPENGNPLQSMLVGFAYQKLTRDSIQRTLSSYSTQGPTAQLLKSLSPDFREKLTESLSIWAHNTGPGGITQPLRFLLSTQQGRSLLKAENLDGFMEALKAGIQHFHEVSLLKCAQKQGKAQEACHRRVREVTAFYGNVKRNSRSMSNSAGMQTGENKCGI